MKNMTRNNQILLLVAVFGLVFSLMTFLPIFSERAEAAVSCPASYCNYNGHCYASGTTYNNYICSNGRITQINNSVSNLNSNSGSNNYQVQTSASFYIPDININSSGASTYITNPTNKSISLTLVSYKVYDTVLSHQTIYDYDSVTVAPHSNASLNVSVPSCMSQADLYYGLSPKPATASEISSAVYQAPFCNDNPPTPDPEPRPTPDPRPEPTPDLSGSCSANPSSINIGGSVTWSASASGGNGSYHYSWSGTDGLSGNSPFAAKSYTSAGTKNATVVITSGSQSVTRNCSLIVNQNNIVDDLSVYCNASQSSLDVDENMTWRAYASGGDGSYYYDWSGSESLNGNSRNITWSYDSTGTKRATVTVWSNGQTATASCTTRVNDDNNNDDLSVSCYARPETAGVGSRIRWYVDVDGGDGDYEYDWTGTNNLNSSSENPYKTYSTVGRKSARVTVTDGDGNTDSDTCYVNINSVLAYSESYQDPLVDAVYLSQVPYTGSDNKTAYYFIGFLSLISAWIAYIIIARKKEMGELK
jgi:hypothetical protein